MAGVYDRWFHKSARGDPQSPATTAAARKLLGSLEADLKRGGLFTGVRRQILADGTTIEAFIAGGIPKVRVYTPPKQEEDMESLPDSYVCYPRNAAYPDGFGANAETALRRPANETWLTLFFNTMDTLFSVFTGRKSTYREFFPSGLKQAGNLDWRSKRGQRLSWYGPSTRYWFEPFVQMTAQYSDKVFMLGLPTLSTDQYIIDSAPAPAFNERTVLGAAMRRGWLYVVQIQAQNLTVPVPVPVALVAPNDGYTFIGPSYSPVPVATAVCRYRLAKRLGEDLGLRVLAGTREVLWTGDVARGFQPYFFAPDASEALSFLPPANLIYGSTLYAPTPEASTTRRRLVLAFDDEADTAVVSWDNTEVSIPATGDTGAPVAADWNEAGNLVEVLVRRRDLNLPTIGGTTGDLSQRFDIQIAGANVELRSLYRQPATDNYLDVRRYVMWADARTGVLVCRRVEVWFVDPPPSFTSMQVWLEVWVNGVLTVNRTDGLTAVVETNNSFGTQLTYTSNLSDKQSQSRGTALAPMLPLYGWNVGNLVLPTPLAHYIAGAHAGFAYLPRQTGKYFSYYLEGRISSGGVDLITYYRVFANETAVAAPAAVRLDTNGMDSVLGAASWKNYVLLSAYPKAGGFSFGSDHLVWPSDSAQLPALTGVIDPEARYHPIWLLGKPPLPN